jgi:hypothetical protein
MCRIPRVSSRRSAAAPIEATRREVLHGETPGDRWKAGLDGYARIPKIERLPMKKLIAALFATAMLGGCAVYTDGPGHGGGGYGKQCPPGQAKKGNC